MRPTAQPQSAFAMPLNHILGTEVNVRLLRVLAGSSSPMAISALARLAAVTERGARAAIVSLVDVGIVELVGTGSRRQVQFRTDHPLADALAALFASETRRVAAVHKSIQAAVARISPPPLAAWLEGPVALGSDGHGEPLVVRVLADSANVDRLVPALRDALAEVDRTQDVTIEIRGLTRADLAVDSDAARRALAGAIPLVGPPPTAFIANPPRRKARRGATQMTHAELDARARALANAVANAIKSDPSIVTRARERIAMRLEKAVTGESLELEEWDHILRTMSVPRLRRFLVDPGERASRLRQTLPFLDVLNQVQRGAVMGEGRGTIQRRRS